MLAYPPTTALSVTPPGQDQDQPNKPWLLRYDPTYNAHTAVPVPTSGVVTNYLWSTALNAATFPPAIAGAWVTEDCIGSETAGGLLGNPGRYTDLVVNLADPGSPIIQPVACPDSFTAGGVPNYGGMAYTFDSTEPDTRIQGKTFNFPNMATIVEASRGNLDTLSNFQSSMPSPYDAQKQGTVIDFTGSVLVLTPPAGETYYQLAYQRLAMLESQPFATAVDSAVNGFFYKLNGLADCRFGLVGFSTSQPPGPPYTAAGNDGGISATGPNLNTIGTYDIYSYYVTYYPNYGTVWQSYTGSGGNYSPSPGATAGANNVQPVAGSAGEEGFRCPRTQLSATYQNMNEVCSMPVSATVPWTDPDGSPAGQMWSSMATGANGLWNGRPMADTYTAEALDTAIKMFNNGGTYNLGNRPASRKAIVFFTDGEPTGGISGTDGTKSTSTLAPAAKANGIAIFTIGLNMNGNAQLTADQQLFLGDNVPPNGPGLAYIAGNGGNFFMCSDSKSVRQAFINVARRLSQNQQ
jgi:hypothetical protein